MVLMTIFTGQQWRCRCKERTYEQCWGWDEQTQQHGNIHTTLYKTDSQWELPVCLREFKLVLCDNLEGWDGMGGGRKVQEAVDICIPMADSY